jgi:hypothetical protein
VTPRYRYSFYIDPDQRASLTEVKERDGISESEQIRRAIATWLESKGVIKAERKRAKSKSTVQGGDRLKGFGRAKGDH